MTKRKRFILTSVLLSLGFVGIQFLDERFRFIGIAALAVLTLVLFIWSLRESLKLNASLLSLVLPLTFTVGVGLFWFLLPSNIFTRIPIIIVYGVGIYALCLTANIYTVSAIRTIALLRAARGVGFVLTMFVSFLIFDAILSIRASILITSALVIIVSFPLYLQGYWTVLLNKDFSPDFLKVSFVSSVIMGEVSLGLYFWPVSVVVGSLFFTVTLYVMLGLGQARLEGRLFRQTIKEYLILGSVVFIGMFLATSWRG